MGYIVEPKGVDFVVESKPLTEKDKEMISEVIAHYKTTGKKLRTTSQKATGKSGKVRRVTQG